jgi:hypothetical protein
MLPKRRQIYETNLLDHCCRGDRRSEVDVADAPTCQTYVDGVNPVIAKHGGKFIVRGGNRSGIIAGRYQGGREQLDAFCKVLTTGSDLAETNLLRFPKTKDDHVRQSAAQHPTIRTPAFPHRSIRLGLADQQYLDCTNAP